MPEVNERWERFKELYNGERKLRSWSYTQWLNKNKRKAYQENPNGCVQKVSADSDLFIINQDEFTKFCLSEKCNAL